MRIPDNFKQRTLDEIKQDFEKAQNPEFRSGDIMRAIQQNADFWQRWEEEWYREQQGLESFEERQQYALRGQYQPSQ